MKNAIVETALQTVQLEAKSIADLATFLDASFVETIELLNNCKGRLVFSGIGKSALIAQKIVATLNSTGTPSLFMHAADAIHGDLGAVQKDDIVLIISKSGESPEIKALVPYIKNFGNKLIGIVGNTSSYLAAASDHILNTTVSSEACPNNLAPTSSTTAGTKARWAASSAWPGPSRRRIGGRPYPGSGVEPEPRPQPARQLHAQAGVISKDLKSLSYANTQEQFVEHSVKLDTTHGPAIFFHQTTNPHTTINVT
jgi:D-arabinose 5-phosphate isomerase GutQ